MQQTQFLRPSKNAVLWHCILGFTSVFIKKIYIIIIIIIIIII